MLTSLELRGKEKYTAKPTIDPAGPEHKNSDLGPKWLGSSSRNVTT
jgi:hypothetical protein